MLISVITPTRNRASSFLSDCLESVACQRLPAGWSIEHVVCDDASSQEDLDALSRLIPRYPNLRVVYREVPGGVSAARNTAFLASRGEVVVDLDDDDVLPGDAVARRVRHLLVSGRAWSCGDMLKVDEELKYLIGRDLAVDPGDAPADQEGFLQALLAGEVYAWAGTRTYLRSALLTAGPWDESFPVAEDLEHWLRLTALVGSPAWFPAPAVIYREKQRSLGIDAVTDGSMAMHAERARSRYRAWPTIQEPLPTWDSGPGSQHTAATPAIPVTPASSCARCGRPQLGDYCPGCGERRLQGLDCGRCFQTIISYCPSCGERWESSAG